MKTTGDNNSPKVRWMKRKELDESKWSELVSSYQMPVYAEHFYLDAITDWEILVADDYQTVCPVPLRKKILTSCHQPLFSHGFTWYGQKRSDKPIDYILDRFTCVSLYQEYESLEHGKRVYQQIKRGEFPSKYPNRKLMKGLRTAIKHQLTIVKDLETEHFKELYQKWMQPKIGFRTNSHIQILTRLIDSCKKWGKGKIYATLNEKGEVICADFFAFNDHFLYLPTCVTLPESKDKKAHLFTIDNILRDFALENKRTIHFGGSNSPRFASFNYNFEAKDQLYSYCQKNSFLRFF